MASHRSVAEEISEELKSLSVRLANVRKKEFKRLERVRGRLIFSTAEQRRIVDCVYDFQEKGRKGRLRECTYSEPRKLMRDKGRITIQFDCCYNYERTYLEPRKWKRGKGRITIQFGCCYNYALDKNENLPGIIRDEKVDPIPPLFKQMIKSMIAWNILPPSRIPDSCIVNIYEKGVCITPHIDHHDFARPFCTVSFLSECNIIFETKMKTIGPEDFLRIPLPLGYVLVLNGNSANVAKHCITNVPIRRISVTFRKMDDSKVPYGFIPGPELQILRPLPLLFQGQHPNIHSL